jgi:hypothetical protein
VPRYAATGTLPDWTSGGVTVDAVIGYLRLGTPGADDLELLEAIVAAVNTAVARLPYTRATALQPDPDLPAVVWAADVTHGALMQAARTYTRRNTPAGVQAMTDVVVYAPRFDPDVDQLLHTGAYQRIQIG